MRYRIFDESKGERSPMLMHDTARPFVAFITDPAHSRLLGYGFIGRYETRKAAMAAIRRDRAQWSNR